ncbi:polysaccharide deacetylase family protein [Desulforamulus ferrireducens]|uniref:Polysaccharide deacetylase family protein n=1 Tax=Desulforamulus ferrireducens TaxID=1833852 RepID=A0A1S6IU08_9FIRM|nr:polysaccharide deacetylase family protein [Desulforamulus ferrireducens]AQS58266.1 polysaccharide deacetylase family protein [Desulforamulus ferrireducens]
MWLDILKLAGLLVAIYTLPPTFLTRCLHLGIFASGNKFSGRVALTFDDGPDPHYTGQVLDILKAHQAKASFFLVGQYAKEHPELVQRINSEGHTIGSHGEGHCFCWLQGPLASLREIKQGLASIEAVTGEKCHFFRPSWGIFNLCSLLYLWKQRYTTVLWSFMSWDWSGRITSQRMVELVMRKVKAGSIIVFHDRSTGPGAAAQGPQQMLEALPQILQQLQARGLQPVTLEELYLYREMGLIKKGLQNLWQIWELCFERLAGLKPLAEGENQLFRLAVRNYRGSEMRLTDGTLVTPGDKVLELHFNNHLLQHIASTARSLESVGIMLLRETRRSLPLLAKVISSEPNYQGIKAIMGITMIHRGTKQLGFTVYDLPPLLRPLVTWYQRWLMFLLHPGGLSHVRRQWHKLVPKKVVISKKELLQRYLDGISWPESGNTNPARGKIKAR